MERDGTVTTRRGRDEAQKRKKIKRNKKIKIKKKGRKERGRKRASFCTSFYSPASAIAKELLKLQVRRSAARKLKRCHSDASRRV
ncbi:hypothetical protein PUN28_017357 [Cardiocondyla obscurior]|uniref:Uncharacterized protein n=1 Tax=Cardiocondyla obscurior TaxID=286306 RepID=A0AAW2EQA4_9HYME